MADKQTTLSIIIRTVDKATAGLKKITGGIKEHTEGKHAPGHKGGGEHGHEKEKTEAVNSLGAALGRLSHETGLPHVFEKFKHVGHAAHEVWEQVGELKEKFLEFAIGVGIGALEVEHLIHAYAELGKTAKIVGLTVDSLAAYRFAAEQAGLSSEEFDGALEKLNKGLGEMKAGGGKLSAFLGKVSPALLRQVKAAKSNEEALSLISAAFVKVTDPAKRAALATAVFGKAGQTMIAMLAEGPEKLEENRKEYEELAGSQEEAAETAHHVHQAMGRVSAAADGIKAAIVVGLGPAIEHLAELLKEFLVKHRQEIADFIKDFGEKLPGRIESLVHSFQSALDAIMPVWDAIGGLKGAAIGLAVIIGAKLIAAVYGLGVALISTPIGWIIAGIAGIVAGIVILTQELDRAVTALEKFKAISDFLVSTGGGIAAPKGGGILAGVNKDLEESRKEILGLGVGGFTVGGPAAPAEAKIKIDIAGAPKGTRVTTDPRSTADVDLNVGYNLGFT